MSTLQVVLQNNSESAVHAAITGTDSVRNALWLLQSDGTTGYYPENPAADQQPLPVDCNMSLGGCGQRRTVALPYLSGARIWFSQDGPLTFLLNQGVNGPALVEPSPTNPSDPNYPLRWDFCELTFNNEQVFANVSYVDFICIPVALRLDVADGSGPQVVTGMPANGLDTVCQALQQQHRQDGADWDKLVVRARPSAASPYLRALSPYAAIATSPGLFQNYYAAYVDAVWARYAATPLLVETQSSWGTASGQVRGGLLQFPGVGAFSRPAAADVFSCSTGPFGANAESPEMGNIAARLAAAFNRSTLLLANRQPDGEVASSYYVDSITNHYARIVHATNVDGRGYAFPYDDVTPTSGSDESGAVSSSSPARLTVYVGGLGGSVGERTTHDRTRVTRVHAREMARRNRQLVAGRRQARAAPASLSRRSSTGMSTGSSKMTAAAALDTSTAAQWNYLQQLRSAEKGSLPGAGRRERRQDRPLWPRLKAVRMAWSLLLAALPQTIAGPLARASAGALHGIDFLTRAIVCLGALDVARVFAVAAGILVLLSLARIAVSGPVL